jgi:hypothetical protein
LKIVHEPCMKSQRAANVGRTRQDRECRSQPLLDSCRQKRRRQVKKHVQMLKITRALLTTE